MSTEPRSTFLMVRSHAALASANEELAAYQSVVRNHTADHDLETLLGIWVDEDGVANLPCALVLPDASGAQRTVRILEAMGINGIWMLCWRRYREWRSRTWIEGRGCSRYKSMACLPSCEGMGTIQS